MGSSSEGNFSFYAHHVELWSGQKTTTNKFHSKNDCGSKEACTGIHSKAKSSLNNCLTSPHPPASPKPFILKAKDNGSIRNRQSQLGQLNGRLPPITRSISSGSLVSSNSNRSSTSSRSSEASSLPPIEQKKRTLDLSNDADIINHSLTNSTERLISSYQDHLCDLDTGTDVNGRSSIQKPTNTMDHHGKTLSSSSNDDNSDFSVSSIDDISESGQTMVNELAKASGPFQPLYSIPTRKSQKNDPNEKSFQTVSVASYEFLPLRYQLSQISILQRTLSNPEIDKDKQLAVLRSKLLSDKKDVRLIPSTESNSHIECSTILDSSKTSGNYETILNYDEQLSPNKKLKFKTLAAMTRNLVPRISTAGARSHATDNMIGDLAIYLPDGKLRVFCSTWNMKGTKDVPECLDDLLLPAESEFMQDVYIIATQEGTPLRKEWELKLQESLGPSHVLMHSASFGVLYLSIFIRRELVWFCTGIEQDTIATRIGHKIKTKGAIAVGFKVFGTSILVIDSHFTSNEGKIKDRINDYQTISKSLQLPSDDSSNENLAEEDVTSRYDCVFWMGDFNFRVVKPRKEVDVLLANKTAKQSKISILMEFDQLTQLFTSREIFHGFKEGDINFLPTYKFDVNSTRYDTSSKQRVQSWTDRILYKTKDANSISMQCYNCCSSLLVSDHRPVYGIFEVEISPSASKYVPLGAHFDRQIYIEANIRRTAPRGGQSSSAVCAIL